MHEFCCCDNIHVCRVIALYTANAYSAKCEMSASACIRSVPGFLVELIVWFAGAFRPSWAVHWQLRPDGGIPEWHRDQQQWWR